MATYEGQAGPASYKPARMEQPPREGDVCVSDHPSAASVTLEVQLSAGGPLILVLPPGEVVTGTMAAAAAEDIIRLAGAGKLPLLLTLSGVEAITRGAREVFNAARSLSAVAVIGVSPVDRVIANFLLGGEVQPCPTRYFSREAEARSWLERFAA